MKVLGISGSLRRGSYNTRLLRAAASTLPPAAELEIYEPEDLWRIPPYSEDAEALGEPEAVTSLRRAMAEADAVLFATPEYNHSLPGQLKNAIDWVSRPVETNPLHTKAVAVGGASTSTFGAIWAQADLRRILGALHARVVELELPVPYAAAAFDDDDGLRDPDARATLELLIGELMREAEPQLVAV
jgi:chromate reductase, NAD(P)H dehydrogenase (quinone)